MGGANKIPFLADHT